MGDNTALLIESHPCLRQALEQVLVGIGLELLEEPADPVDAVDRAVRLQPALVVVDTTLAHASGTMIGQLIHRLVPRSAVILLVDDASAYRQLAEGQPALACLDKRVAAHELGPLARRLLDEARARKEGDSS